MNFGQFLNLVVAGGSMGACIAMLFFGVEPPEPKMVAVLAYLAIGALALHQFRTDP